MTGSVRSVEGTVEDSSTEALAEPAWAAQVALMVALTADVF